MARNADQRRVPPTGAQFELVHGDLHAVVVEFGGGIRELRAGPRPLLDGYGVEEMCSSGRGQLLLPWPNRIRDGRYEWEGQTLQLALTEPAKGNAIHGLARRSPWRLGEQAPDRVVLEHVVYPREGYPFTVAVSVEYSLDDDGLTVRTTATNVGSSPCPYGFGAHPYLTAGTETIDECYLQAPGAAWLQSDERAIPTGREPVEGTSYDFRAPRRIGDAQLDTPFTELECGSDGRARVILAAPGAGDAVELWMDEHHDYLMLFTGDTIGDPARRRRGLAAEPMTCPPNAFASGEGLRRLEPGESFSCAWGVCTGLADRVVQ